ncbi:unnamed protein product, partial [Mesorhabditis belari]|uniref:Uncharacterized protein n=1 Tax=Mesorhabditis belari TaxID=2138241 RepID=A0AAF3E8P6_9BILA
MGNEIFVYASGGYWKNEIKEDKGELELFLYNQSYVCTTLSDFIVPTKKRTRNRSLATTEDTSNDWELMRLYHFDGGAYKVKVLQKKKVSLDGRYGKLKKTYLGVNR